MSSSASAFVAIGMGATQKDSHVNSAKSLESINIPVLDLYGSEDLPEVIASSEQRAAQAGGDGGEYTQQRVEGADHFFDGEENIDDLPGAFAESMWTMIAAPPGP